LTHSEAPLTPCTSLFTFGEPTLGGACGAARTIVSVWLLVTADRGVTVVTLLVAAAALARTVVFPATVNCGSTSIRSEVSLYPVNWKNSAAAQ
jgi:hypothetical protein